MTAIRFRPNSKISTGVFAESRISEPDLQELPYIDSGFLRCINIFGSVRETNSNRLVDE